ncbi:MAG: hypothetical protein A2096_05350 [Spirochaetes bacterium GWF1_41_5]|nr:MAG: hypothetical protein A2096_05350 [Spirochaetes bacterium GWF1_41_5]HBE04040.1 biopolymer transporter ExbD [Spirochaetia bacterium]
MKFRKNLEPRLGIDMTPMVDIVFLLIIFFMIASTYVKTSGIRVNLPEAVSSDSHPKNDLVISVNENGDIFLDDRKVAMDSLQKLLKEEKIKSGRSALIIKGDRNIRYKSLVLVMDRAKMAGIEKISLATGKRN